MDPLTHAVSGIALARAVPRHRLEGKYVLLVMVVAMAPDIDYALRLVSDTVYLQYHRGITHSILLLPLWVWLLVSLMPTLRLRRPILPWLMAMALAMHIGLDLLTSFGTMIYAPLSNARVTWDLVFIIDPLFTAALAAPILLSLLWRRRARRLAWMGLLLMFAYVSWATVLHQRALQLVWQAQPTAIEAFALPQPFSPCRWQLIASFPDHYERALVDLWPGFRGSALFFPRSFVRRVAGDARPPGSLQWKRFVAMRAVPGVRSLPGSRFYLWFARFPVLLEQSPEKWVFGDLRFGAGSIPNPPFRLEIDRVPKPAAWLVWRRHRSRIHDSGR
jgi:Predicted membrane-bound metal-dependent hydrolases